MNRINDSRVKKAYMGKTVGVIVGIVLTAIAVLLIAFSVIAASNASKEAIEFGQAYNDGRLEDDIIVYIVASDGPYEIGEYDATEQYYFVGDNTDLYIIRCSKSQYESISDEIETKGASNIRGTIVTLNEEVIESAIEVYNGDDTENLMTRSDFDNYFAGVALKVDGNTSSQDMFMVFGILILVFGLICLIAGGVEHFKYRKAVKRLSDAEAEMINAELEDPQTVYIKKCRVFLTPKRIVSLGNSLEIIPYEDILWAYKFEQSYSFVPILTNIKMLTKDFKTRAIADMTGVQTNKDATISQIFSTMQAHNPQIAFGFTPELNNYFKQLQRGNRT